MTDKAVLKLLSVRTPTLMYRIDTTLRQYRQLYLGYKMVVKMLKVRDAK